MLNIIVDFACYGLIARCGLYFAPENLGSYLKYHFGTRELHTTSLQILLEVGAFSAATVMAGRLRPVWLAAHQIAFNTASVTYMVRLGVAGATAAGVGHRLARGAVAACRGGG